MGVTIDAGSVKRIIVRGPNWIGDAVMCTPALLMLREVFPSASITLLVKPTIADLLGSHSSVDDVVVYDHKGRHAGLSGKLSLIRELRQKHYDVAVLFQNALEAALLMWLAGVPRRVGYPTDGRGLLLNHSILLPLSVTTMHQVEYYQQLIASLNANAKRHAPTLFVQSDVEAEVEERVKGLGMKDCDILIGLNPGSVYGGAKRWLPVRFAETADYLVENTLSQGDVECTVRCVIVGAPGEEELGRAIAAEMRNPPIVLSGKTTLQELMTIIKRCRLFITNDTGPMHIANAFGVPVVAIFGPTDHRTTSPFHGRYAIVRHPVDCSPCLLRECPIDHRCMTHVSVADVVRSAEQLVVPSRNQRVMSD